MVEQSLELTKLSDKVDVSNGQPLASFYGENADGNAKLFVSAYKRREKKQKAPDPLGTRAHNLIRWYASKYKEIIKDAYKVENGAKETEAAKRILRHADNAGADREEIKKRLVSHLKTDDDKFLARNGHSLAAFKWNAHSDVEIARKGGKLDSLKRKSPVKTCRTCSTTWIPQETGSYTCPKCTKT